MQYKNFQQIKYPMCDQGGYHSGELMNSICLEKECRNNSLLCSACSHENHRSHKQRPLKLFIYENLQKQDQIKKYFVNYSSNEEQVLLQSIEEIKKEMLADFRQQMEEIKQMASQIELQYVEYFESLKESIQKQNKVFKYMQNIKQNLFNTEIGKNELQQKIIALMEQQELIKMLQEHMQQEQEELDSEEDFTINSVCTQTSNGQENNNTKENGNQQQKEQQDGFENNSENSNFIAKNIMENVKDQIHSMRSIVNEHNLDIQKNFQEIQNFISGQSKNSISTMLNFKVQFYFDNLMHEFIQKKNKFTVVSQSSSGYKMAVLEPPLKQKRRQFAFKIKNIGTSNWIGLGICIKNKVVDKKFGFQSSLLGHGAYMISSNGGSWSSHKKENNQCVKAFGFKKNDIVVCDYQPDNQKILFRHHKTQQVYTLQIEISPNIEYHPGLIFYSMEDEVEFLNQVPKEKK